MENSVFKLSFVDSSVNLRHNGNKTHASIKTGFKFSVFNRWFNQCGINTVPEFVVTILNKYGYVADYKLNMWVTTTTGKSQLNDVDTYNEHVGDKLAIARAKRKAYINGMNVISELWNMFENLMVLCENTHYNLFNDECYEEEYIESLENLNNE